MGEMFANLIKRALPVQRWRMVRRATNRLRWLLKCRLLKAYGFPIGRRPLLAAKYVLWDPEVESYTYEVANEAEIAEFLSGAIQVDRTQIEAWMHEAKTDRYLARDRGFCWHRKRRLPLGNRLMWYPIVRALKPKLIVEAGVHEGLSSEMFLVALRRNADEGSPGRLISFDIHQDTGWLVHKDLRDNWTLLIENTAMGMEPALRGLEVDLFVHETPHKDETITAELEAVIRHAGPRLVVIDSSGADCPTLQRYCERFGSRYYFIHDIPKDHIVRSHGMGFTVFERDKMRQASEASTAAAPL